ncbi:MAG TPA: Lrp/AsnC family transcriptional regulator [Desulfobacteraceae bacterium]|nr:Lrp/AsnC family transcriptional regulator [Desulfobacteraceae bacterium]
MNLLQKDLPLDPRPFAVMADRVGITEEEFIERVKVFVSKGIIRRFGATLYHQEAGFPSNAMVAWVVDEDEEETEKAGRAMAEFKEVTHCYQRKPRKNWKYNLYTMIHADSRGECYEIARRISQSTGIHEYILLFSEKEYKKTSMEYFK